MAHEGVPATGLMASTLLWLGACHPAAVERDPPAVDAAARGREVIEDAGCAACHVIPGIAWPKGRTGPDLAGLADRAFIAGRLPNRPHVVAAFVRDPPALVPGTAMPPTNLSPGEARDVAAYLATLRAR